ncbi:vacuolar transporter chaperone [Rhizopus stolonifer]|uniref:Vacuolar transporter chaperone n=1 Tax=Rhizopus stolonifer TaxID=4846 RepID=A0A367KWF5_RHIST|nr:vacuolar transporter chaperone [Rhizopus stolonifer]
MKFGLYLSEHLYSPWKQEYIQYDSFKKLLKQPIWTFEDEMEFTHRIDKEMESISRFIDTKEKEPRGPHETQLLVDFIHLNTLGFQKILKKHDKWTEFTLQHRFIGLRQVDQNMAYHQITYWIHPDQLKELEAVLLFHLPKTHTKATHSVYYDQSDFRHYTNLLQKNGELLRTTLQENVMMFERKTCKEKQVAHYMVSKPSHLAHKDQNVDWMQYTKPLLSCDYQGTLYSADPGCLLTLKTNLRFSSEGRQEYFPYSILLLQITEKIPEWLTEFTEHSHLVNEVPYFEEYLHGMMLLFQPPLLPWWLHQKIPTHSIPIDKPTTQSLLSRIKERFQYPFGQTENGPVFKTDAEMHLFRWLTAKLTQSPLPEKLSKRIEPKLFLGNERILMSWLTFCALLLTLALSLLNFGDQVSRQSGTFFIFIAMAVASYALLRFQYRAWQIRFRDEYRYDDIYGPAGLCFVFILALLINFGLRMSHPTQHPLN